MMRNLIDKALGKLDYYRVEMPKGSALSKEDIIDVMGYAGTDERFPTLLRDLCAQDIRIHFQASSDHDRAKIQGAHERNMYFLSLIKKANARKRK